jgi:hypothetical protein
MDRASFGDNKMKSAFGWVQVNFGVGMDASPVGPGEI